MISDCLDKPILREKLNVDEGFYREMKSIGATGLLEQRTKAAHADLAASRECLRQWKRIQGDNFGPKLENLLKHVEILLEYKAPITQKQNKKRKLN